MKATRSAKVNLEDFLGWLVPKGPIGPLTRIGGFGDGAYLIPDDVKGIEACFSPGVANSKSFEDEVVQLLEIRAHLMDASSDAHKFKTPLLEPMQTFQKKWLGPDESVEDTVCLETWVSNLEPGTSDLALQMDIEGAEYPNLNSAPLSLLSRFRIIIIELHGLAQIASNPRAFWEEKGSGLANLMQNHVVVHAHPNNCCGSVPMDKFPFEMPKVLEISLLRKDRVKRWAAGESHQFQSPHREDIGWNVGGKRPLFLGNHWMRDGLVERTLLRRAAVESAWLYENGLRTQNQLRKLVAASADVGDWRGWSRWPG